MQGIANQRRRGVDRAKIGTAIQDPNIDYMNQPRYGRVVGRADRGS